MRLLITGAWRQAEDYFGTLRSSGHEVAFMRHENGDLPCDPAWVEGIICNGLFLYHPIEKFNNLRYIQLTSAGFDRVPTDVIKDRGIVIRNARGVYSVPMAEYAVSGVLMLYRAAGFFRENQAKHEWVKNRELRELCGSRVLVIGCGSVGTECAKRFRAFGCTVIGTDVALRDDPCYDAIKPVSSIDEEIPLADVLVIMVPSAPDTVNLISGERILKLKRGAVVVNIARGGIVDEKALAASAYRLGGAVLDVFAQEPLSEDSPLWDIPNFIITPHNSFAGHGNDERLSEVIMRNLSCIENGI
ncbi:MAG: D-2-hydroxyacid dehydrogenase [Clostridia bacterium]|nr:D-2-hydroxyacid dehydrogenase [Clostridia bacterium]